MQTLLNQTKQDNPVALNFPVPVTLAGSNLQNSGFEHSFGFTRRDELLVVHHTAPALKNRPATDTYYYNGYWRKNGAGAANFDAQEVFTLDTSVIIRRATNPIGSVIWKMARPYPID